MLGQVKISVAMLDNMLRFGDLAFDVAQFETGKFPSSSGREFPRKPNSDPRTLPASEPQTPIVGSQSLGGSTLKSAAADLR
jgi:hypothetical protein